jgi:hypothetical protein
MLMEVPMSSISENWDALASYNERLASGRDDQPRSQDASSACALPARWSELASQRERLVADPLRGLASSPRPGLRLVVSSAA